MENLMPAKPICENLGIAWKPQYLKLTQDSRCLPDAQAGRCYHMVIPSASGTQEMVSLPLQKLPAWLFSISTNKVKPKFLIENDISYCNK